jgi:hypothetical protein
MDMILSKESLSDWASPAHTPDAAFRNVFWTKLATALQDWNVTVLLTYRRYYEWLPSAYAQHAYHTHIQLNAPWPTTILPPTLTDVLEQVLHQQQPPPYPFLDDILLAPGRPSSPFPSTWKVHVLNLHRQPQQQDIVTTLLCDVLEAHHTCQHYQPITPKRTSPTDALVYDRLNVQANIWKWLKKGGGRRFARMKATRQFVERNSATTMAAAAAAISLTTTTTGTTDCPHHALLQELLDRSLDLEREILGVGDDDNNNDNNNEDSSVAAHTQAFWNHSRQQAFCSVNVTEVLLQDPNTWKDFYQSLP